MAKNIKEQQEDRHEDDCVHEDHSLEQGMFAEDAREEEEIDEDRDEVDVDNDVAEGDEDLYTRSADHIGSRAYGALEFQ